ncbi:MAG: tetratricopeptide repeat protein [Candidatus Rokubacteria bacterium]|nr:tetratricopeptide repeat protein [Candidatus Rokubacteria bacterium]
MPSLIRTLRAVSSAAGIVNRLLGAPRAETSGADSRVAALMAMAADARGAGRYADARSLYEQALQRNRYHLSALRALRDLAVESGRWEDAIEPQQRLIALGPAGERARETEWLAVIHYELGRARMAAGAPRDALVHFRNAVRADRRFVPATIALGDAHEAAGERREALRVWERAAEVTPALPILARLERAYREEGRPTRMIALYRLALERAPDDLALAVALGRVYFELEMLDEAADHFEKIEVRAPELPAVHAFLGAIFERRGQGREAFEEYRRGLQLAHAFAVPQRCTECGAVAPMWRDRCGACGRWNTLRP